MRLAARAELVVAPLHPELQAELIGAWPASLAASEPRVVVLPHRNLAASLLEARVRACGVAVGIRAMTWLDLALELTTAERTEAGRRSLDGEAQSWLVQQLRDQTRRAPTVYDAALGTRGFRVALLRAFSELEQTGLASRRDIEAFIARNAIDLPLEVRHLLELALAYRKSFDATHDDA